MIRHTAALAAVVAIPLVALLLLAPGCEHALAGLLSGAYNRLEPAWTPTPTQ